MISWKLNDEKEMMVYYANLLNDDEIIKVIERGKIVSKEEALHVAEFFWKMVEKSNEVEYKNSATE